MIKIADDIAREFADLLCPTCGELNDDAAPYISFTHPNAPLQSRTLVFRDNWEIVSASGIDELADVQLTTSNNQYGDGVQVRSSRRVEKTVRFVLRICPCDGYDIYESRRELYEILGCSWDQSEPCLVCCEGDNCSAETLCFSDFAIKDQRYCEMIIQCGGIIRALSVIRNGSLIETREGNCYLFEFEYLAPSPYLYQPCLMSEIVTLEQTDLTGCPTEICGNVHFDFMQGFEKCITIPYTGNVDGRMKITVVGNVTDLQFEIVETGVVFNLNRRNNTIQLAGCGANVFNFMPGQVSFTLADGSNVYQDVSAGCSQHFVLSGDTEICITGKQVNYENLLIRFDWWNEFDGFFLAENEAACISACDDDGECC